MDLILKCKKIKRGLTKDGRDYLMIGFGDGITGFPAKDRLEEFKDVKEGDPIKVEVYNFRNDGGVKFIPRSIYQK